MNKLKYWLVGIFLIGLFTLSGVGSYASELKFSVEPVLPDNQLDNKNTYFDLMVKPEQKQTLVIHMRNDTDKEVVVEPKIHAATTNINGVVEYGESNTTLDETAPFDLAKLVVPEEKEVKIPAKSTHDLKMTVQMPKEAFKGMLAGGITLQEKEQKQEKESKKKEEQGLAIENKYAYVVAIVLQESKDKVAQKLSLETVKPDQVNARNVINATLKNPEPTYINQLSVKAKITKKGEKESLYTSEKKEMQMAPNTSFAYPIALKGERLEPGKYTLEMQATSSKEKWSFTKDFEIKAETAKKLNDKDVTIQKNDNLWLYSSLIILIVFVIILLGILIYQKKKTKGPKSSN
ncbi:DUF916 and DUF3324 domain-containing protein [Enterococcus faecalis]|nr:DUF916 and DUF3324 domain-containing protein [Enterococcus faecalis]HBI1555844.1 DUF916 and DUF3324 domain-containing protein [Enterococcus faecalis]HBI1558907.1 DUF916 and DUF3324 domain-containing protein [Enterococcus faecalis]HBI1567800.1 DUF916 and DUF3324 domain-containing protein [Enterococcus faecalis]